MHMENMYQWKVKEFKKMTSPIKGDGIIKYVMYVNLKSFSNDLFNNWMNTNPRYQNMKSKPGKRIIDSLRDEPSKFHERSRGLLFSAKNITFDNSKEIATVEFEDNEIHGNIDGGHTFKAILSEIDENSDDAFVFVEVFTNIKDQDEIVSLADARNTSLQVDEKSLIEMQDGFNCLKAIIEAPNSIIKDQVYYSMNENKEDINKKIDIRTIIAISNMFNLSINPNGIGTAPPIQSYSSKASSLDKYQDLEEKKEESINQLAPIFWDILNLYDAIEVDFFSEPILNKMKNKFSTITWHLAGNKEIYSTFKHQKIFNKVPTAIVYPILGGFRSLVELDEERNLLKWKNNLNPLDVWQKNREAIITNIIFESDSMTNPNGLGKQRLIWDSIFNYLYAFGVKPNE